MKPIHFLLAGAAALAAAACNSEQQPQAAGSDGATGPIETVQRPASGDWSEAVTATDEGGFVMGNPDAEVKLVEFGSMTCPACANFDKTGVPELIEKYVKGGKVSFEFRNYVRDPYDITAALIARCNGARTFFPLTRAMFSGQADWLGKVQEVPPAQMEGLQTMPPAAAVQRPSPNGRACSSSRRCAAFRPPRAASAWPTRARSTGWCR